MNEYFDEVKLFQDVNAVAPKSIINKLYRCLRETKRRNSFAVHRQQHKH